MKCTFHKAVNLKLNYFVDDNNVRVQAPCYILEMSTHTYKIGWLHQQTLKRTKQKSKKTTTHRRTCIHSSIDWHIISKLKPQWIYSIGFHVAQLFVRFHTKDRDRHGTLSTNLQFIGYELLHNQNVKIKQCTISSAYSQYPRQYTNTPNYKKHNHPWW